MRNQHTYKRAEIVEKVADDLNLSEEQKSERIKSGRPTYIDYAQWAMTYLKQAGALRNGKRGDGRIDAVKRQNPLEINVLFVQTKNYTTGGISVCYHQEK